jgi:competence/damage-inducible protein CinA-like protein
MDKAKRPKSQLIFIGTELLRGKNNTYDSHFSVLLKQLGFELTKSSVLSDSITDISKAIKDALKTSELIILTGGLGPTFDDITREAVSLATGKKLVKSQKILDQIKLRFKRFKKAMPANNIRQAMVFAGAVPIINKVGTAPGQILNLRQNGKTKTIILLPGPMTEWQPMIKTVQSHMQKTFKALNRQYFSETRIFGVPESKVDEIIQPIIKKLSDVEFTILSSSKTITLHASSSNKKSLKEFSSKIKTIFKNEIFSTKGESLAEVLQKTFIAKKATLAIAESCTGGLVSHFITEVSGSSNYFKGCVVAYSNDVKINLLGVKKETIKKYGAVSRHCAVEMAKNVRKKLNATCGLSITGIAGPGGGTKQKPVGTVYMAISLQNGYSDCIKTQSFSTRSNIKLFTAQTALNYLGRH